jgi:hypothetical protein
MAINDYTANINGIEKDEKNQKDDLKLTQEASKGYIGAMTSFHDDLVSIRKDMNGLDDIGNVGTLASANRARTALINAVSGLSGAQLTADQHKNYADELVKAVKTAHDQFMKSG